ncbi:MAG: hypothetical protein COV31_01425 [Candidatus Yanofskybacteria bacterium CG10_big_fil_rev_8_21_14_0_10_46_23]|uniref:Enolpyruvate transferase domain-containing protein n=1 Tax=Candidatus Yanofskybacteria bacterium CG10_big_fil_rev_8_21_14_0_10_46_23 TaxID=1975098 RepID=A0A2H0R657_9BACT|nr:MAG: hypothetical protein COV31_01425 [Candidatus Yanofskybacteria bacterium CG10_big_fil_rev_8_21_14_0_10_46_23]
MANWKITGPTQIAGDISVHGNKNSALPCITASLLLDKIGDKLTLTNIPQINDVQVLLEIIRHFNIEPRWLDAHTLELTLISTQAPDLNPPI